MNELKEPGKILWLYCKVQEIMEVQSLENFINYIEKLMLQCDETDYVQDSGRCYLKSEYMKDLIYEARELIRYGERTIALENLLENLNEVSIYIDKEAVELAKRAFGSQLSEEKEKVLNSLVK